MNLVEPIMQKLRAVTAGAIVLLWALLASVASYAGAYPSVAEPWLPLAKLSSPVDVSTTSSPITLPTPGSDAWICNTGAQDAYLKFGTNNSVSSATAEGSWLKAGVCGTYDLFPITGELTYFAAVTASGTTTLSVEAGIGTGPALTTSSGGSGSNASVSSTGSAVPGSATYFGMLVSGNLVGVPGTAFGLLTDESTSSQFHTDLSQLHTDLGALNTTVGGSIPAGSNAIGYTGGFDITVPITPTIQAAAYASGNAVGGLQTVSVFRSIVQPSGILNAVSIFWKGTETTPLTFFVFDTNPSSSTCTDKTAFSLASADVGKLILPPFTLTAAAPAVGTTTTSAVSSFAPISAKNQDGTLTTNMYVCAVSGGSFTPAVGDLIEKYSVAQD